MPDHGIVVVTGAAGFIGRACVAQLKANGWRVRGLVRALDGQTAARAEFLSVGDLAAIGAHSLANALRGAVAVVHLAARVHQPERDDAHAAYRAMNVGVTQRLAEAAIAHGVRHFVFASTVKVNGETTAAGRPFRESDPPDPHGEYAQSKWAAEQVLGALAQPSGLRVTALRLPLTYGPGAKANFAALARAVRHGVPLPLASVANQRSILGVGNCCSALATLLASDDAPDRGRVTPYFVADRTPVSTPELIRAIAQAIGVTPRLFALSPGLLRFAGACAGHAATVERLLGSLEVDTSAFCSRFGWAPPVSLARGLAAALRTTAPL
ncbi:MAG: NAD-dependent epimerase/dehydratase family protein [Betaproteobacteria bacterium]